MKIQNMHQMVQDGQVEHMEKKIQIKVYYYQQERVKHLVNREYMIELGMYGNGHWNILLIRTILVPVVGACTATMATMVRQPTVAATIRPATTKVLVSEFHFSKS